MSASNVTEDFKQKMHATLIAETSAGCSLAQFCKDFQNDWKKPVKFYAEQFGFPTVQTMLKALPNEVRVRGDHVSVVVKEETKAVQDLIDNSQANKLANSKKRSSGRGPPPPSLFSQSMPMAPPPNNLFPPIPVPPGFRAAVPSNFCRPPIGFGVFPMLFPTPPNSWSSNCSNWPPPMMNYGYHPNSIGPFNGLVLNTSQRQSAWSGINDSQPPGASFRAPFNGPISNVNALHSDYSSQMHSASKLFATSNNGAGLGPSGLSNTAAPPFWNDYFKDEKVKSVASENVKKEEHKTRTVRNQLDGVSYCTLKDEKIPSSTAEVKFDDAPADVVAERRKKKRRNIRRARRVLEFEEGEIEDEAEEEDYASDSDISLQDEEFCQSSSTSTYYSAAMAELDLGYDSKEEGEECHTFLSSVTTKRIPPNIHRIIFLLQKAGNMMLFKELQDKYEKQYSTKLTNVELRTVLGAPEAKNTLVAFQQCPLARLFKYEMTTTGSGVVKLLTDNDNGSDVLNGLFTGSVSNVSDFGRLSASTSTLSIYSKASTVLITPFGGTSASHKVSKLRTTDNFVRSDLSDFGLMPSSSMASGGTTPFSSSETFLAPPRPPFLGNAEMTPLDEIPLPPGSPVAFASSDSTQTLSREVSSSSLSPTAMREITKKLSVNAVNLLTLASMAYDLAEEELALDALYRALRVQTSFEEFTYSPSQMLGYLLMFFSECFQVITLSSGDKQQVGVVATDVRPNQKAFCLADFPVCLHKFPCAADSIAVPSADSERREAAFVVHCDGVTDTGCLHFVVQLTSYEKTRSALEQFLISYDKILVDSEERPLSSTTVGQRVFYRDLSENRPLARRLKRCRIVEQNERTSILECMDTGSRISALPEQIFEFSSVLSTMPGGLASTERFPALAIHCEFVPVPRFASDQNALNEMLEVFSKLIDKRTPVFVQLSDSFRRSDFMPGFKVRLFVPDGSAEEKLYPDCLANES